MVAQVTKRSKAAEAKMRQRILKLKMTEQNGRCFYCKVRILLPANTTDSNPYMATFDHIRPVSQMGITHEDNCVVACRMCNSMKSSMEFDKFKALFTAFIKSYDHTKVSLGKCSKYIRKLDKYYSNLST